MTLANGKKAKKIFTNTSQSADAPPTKKTLKSPNRRNIVKMKGRKAAKAQSKSKPVKKSVKAQSKSKPVKKSDKAQGVKRKQTDPFEFDEDDDEPAAGSARKKQKTTLRDVTVSPVLVHASAVVPQRNPSPKRRRGARRGILK